jgi:hypothetical protein
MMVRDIISRDLHSELSTLASGCGAGCGIYKHCAHVKPLGKAVPAVALTGGYITNLEHLTVKTFALHFLPLVKC